jgi:hypothetical protein
MRGQRAVALVPRGVRVPEEGAALAIMSYVFFLYLLYYIYQYMCRMRGQRAVALVSRGVRVPEEGAALLHPLHGRALQLHRPPRPTHPPVPRLHGGKSA